MDNLVQLGKANIHEAERIKGHLLTRGVRVELAVSPGDCGGGKCGISAEMWVRPEDIPEIQKFFDGERARNHSGLEFDPALISQVFDKDAAEATCPACATVFSTSLSECPDCGLGFAIPDEE